MTPGIDLGGPDRWPEVYGRTGLLTVEIGFGKDEFLLEIAERRPEDLFLAIDFSRPRAHSYLNKIERRGLTNVRVLLEHAANAIGLCLADDAVGEYYVLCPDPWPKARHAANRLVSPWFAREVARTLVPGGRIVLATDDEPYREQILDVMESHGGFTNLLGPGGHGERPEEFAATLFEKRWIGKGREVAYMQFRRRDGS